MRRYPRNSHRKNEQGLIITLVAIFMLGVVGAMAALSIDVVTLYTARSEAQLAADGAALAGARVLANSGMTSDPSAASDNLMSNAVALATAVATQVAASNQVGGRNLNPAAVSPCTSAEICVNIDTSLTNFLANPRVTVTVQRTDLPTFFARIWGTKQLTVKATATAEAYNPSTLGTTNEPAVAPICVKPWLLPNISPKTGNPIFNPDGTIYDTTSANLLLGWETPPVTPTAGYLQNACSGTGACSPLPSTPLQAWQYVPGDPSSFSPPAASSVTCSPNASGYAGTPYQLSVAGCVQTPIACNQSSINIDQVDTITNANTASAVNCLTHATGNHADRVDETTYSNPYFPFEFLAGSEDPLVAAGVITEGHDMSVSDSIVTVPVFNPPTTGTVTSPVTIIGFVQLFLNPEGHDVHMGGSQAYQVHTMVINMIGCGTSASKTSIVYGNGPSAVPVRLITPPPSS